MGNNTSANTEQGAGFSMGSSGHRDCDGFLATTIRSEDIEDSDKAQCRKTMQAMESSTSFLVAVSEGKATDIAGAHRKSSQALLEPTECSWHDHNRESVRQVKTAQIDPSDAALFIRGEPKPSLAPYACTENASNLLANIEQRILSLIDANEAKQIKLTQLPARYQYAYHSPIQYKQLGFKKLKDLLRSFPSISMPDAQPGFEYACRTKGFIRDVRSRNVDLNPARLLSPMIGNSDASATSNASNQEVSSSVTQVATTQELSGKQMTPALSALDTLAQTSTATCPTAAVATSRTHSSQDQVVLIEQQILSLVNAEADKKVLMSKLPHQYQSLYSVPIPYKQLGYEKLKDLINDFPSITMPEAQSGFEYICCADEGGNLGESKEPAGLSSYAENESTEVFHDASSQSLPQPVDAFAQFEKKILALIDSSPDHRIPLCDIPSLFMSAYSRDIPYMELGYNGLKAVLASLPSVSINYGKNKDDHYVCRANQIVRSIAASHLPEKNMAAFQDDTAEKVDTPDASEDLESLMKAVSEGLASTKMHKQLITFLSRNQDGVTCSQLLKEVRGLPHYIKSRANEAGRDFFSPLAVLRNCEGLECREVDGRNLFFLADTDCIESQVKGLSISMAEQNSASADGAAALEILELLQDKFRGRPWPASKKELKKFISGLDTDTATTLVHWMTEFVTSNDMTPAKRKKEACKRLMFQLKKMGCLGGNNKNLTWDVAMSGQLIEQRKTMQRPDAGELSGTFIGAVSSNNDNTTLPADIPVKLIDTVEKLESLKSIAPFSFPAKFAAEVHEHPVIAIDCEGVPNNLFLIQVATFTATYIFDCIKIGAAEVCETLAPLLMNKAVTKLFHDLHSDATAIAHIGGVQPLRGTLDTQLAVELLTGDLHVGFNQMLQQLGHEQHPSKSGIKQKMNGGLLFAKRPLAPDVLDYVVLDVSLLLGAKERLFNALGDMRGKVQKASDSRALLSPQTGGARQICFDVKREFSITSLELLQEIRPDDMLVPVPLKVSDDTSVLLDMLPEDLRACLVDHTTRLSDIALDKGRAPLAWVNGDRLFLGKEDRVVTADDITCIVARLGGFGSDNRAGLERQLHRISAVRNRQSDIIGLTMRVGRHVTGNATIMSDLLFGDCTKSILFVGEPGSGKTTVVREVTRLLAEQFNVWIVDTSNEIAGDGDVPHPCVGLARRMMVPSLEKQSEVLIECVQNHTPEVMVIDEIGRPTEVEAARTCKQRGVRLVASAHGDLRKLIKNPKLRGLIGGVETVTLGDSQAKLESQKLGKPNGAVQKLKAQRAGSPTFDIIVELRRGAHHEWRIVMDVGEAVDKILEGQKYPAQRRTRDPQSGAFTLNLEKA